MKEHSAHLMLYFIRKRETQQTETKPLQLLIKFREEGKEEGRKEGRKGGRKERRKINNHV